MQEGWNWNRSSETDWRKTDTEKINNLVMKSNLAYLLGFPASGTKYRSIPVFISKIFHNKAVRKKVTKF